MAEFQTFIMLMFAAAIIVGISQKLKVPYPIGLVLGGATIGFNPLRTDIYFDPDLLLGIVLPPILYYAAYGISFREFKRNWRDILSLSLGLVILTTIVIAVLFKWLFPQFSWSLAFAFGALISPPDAIAATTILKRFSISNRLLTILEGESLVNDATALVLYRLAVTAMLMGSFSLAQGTLEFFKISVGGIGLGLVLGMLMQGFSRRYLDAVVGVVFSFTIPYITYFLALYLGVSGVLAVVSNGLIGSQLLVRHQSSLRRVLGFAAWDIFIILMNCFVFIIIGLKLQTLTQTMSFDQMILYTGYACLIALIMMFVRMLWVYAKSAVAYVKALNKPNSFVVCPQIVREAALIGWSGMRGIVSLVAAFSLPYSLPDGMPIEGRDEVVFITFIVIMLTLIIPGLSLSKLTDWLHLQQPISSANVFDIRRNLKLIAEKAINRLHSSKNISDGELDLLMVYVNLKFKVHDSHQSLEKAKSYIIQEQRRKLLEIWERLEIDDKLFNQIEHELDLEETHLARAELK